MEFSQFLRGIYPFESIGATFLFLFGVLCTIIQIAPIQINPWDWLLGWIGERFNAGINKKINQLDERIDKMEEHLNNHIKDKAGKEQHRVEALETTDYVVWYPGKVTAKNEIVKFDLDNDGTYEYVMYAGGRSETSLSVGKIDGWYKVTSNGVKTHTVTRNADGTFTLTPIEQ